MLNSEANFKKTFKSNKVFFNLINVMSFRSPVFYIPPYLLFYSFVSRAMPRDTRNHVVLGLQQFKPAEFAQQMNLNMENAWGILRCILDIIKKLDDGKYLIMKDPNKVRLYKCG